MDSLTTSKDLMSSFVHSKDSMDSLTTSKDLVNFFVHIKGSHSALPAVAIYSGTSLNGYPRIAAIGYITAKSLGPDSFL